MERIYKNFTKGLFNRLENQSIPIESGAASDSLNWMSLGDHIELRRGQTIMGSNIDGLGKISGLFVAERFDSTEVVFRAYDRKIQYYDTVTEDWIESTTTDILPAAASGEDVSFDKYHSLAGAFAYFSSKNSSIYKIPVANPGSVVDLSSNSHRGKIKIKQNRMFLWDRKDTAGGFDTTGLYGSYIDKDELSDYTAVLAENTAGAGTTWAGTLAFKNPVVAMTIATPAVFSISAHKLRAGDPVVFSTTGSLPTGITAGTTYYVITAGLTANEFQLSTTLGGTAINTTGGESGVHTIFASKRTCMYVSIKGTVSGNEEIFRDDRNGGLISNLGSTGTINYATGAYSVTFSGAVTGTPTADYYWEDSTAEGIADFTKATPRVAAQGFTFRQDDGGADFQNIYSIGSDEYCMHTRKTWRLYLSSDDTQATNLIYRNNVGLPYWRAGIETGDGIFFVDAPDSSEPYVRVLEPNQLGTDVIPLSLSDAIDLRDYRFDACVVQEWGNYIAVACRHKSSTVNNAFFLYNRLWKLWDRFDFRVSTMDVYNGELIAGDSASKNVFKLFSGLTDEDTEIPNYWISGKDDLKMEGVKVSNIFEVGGLIQPDQELEIHLSFGNASFIKVATIDGDGPYVDQGQNVNVGSNTLGSEEVGGGGDGIEAHPYRRQFRINTQRFEDVRVKFVATKVGYVSVSRYGFKDVRAKGKDLPPQYVVNG